MIIAERRIAMTVWVYVDTSKNVGDKEHLKLFANQHAADEWFKKHDIAGVAYGYEIISPDMKPHVAQAYKDACDNLINLKKDQLQVTYYTWLMLAALYLLARALPAEPYVREALLGGTVLVGFFSACILLSFQRSIGRFCERLARIYKDYFTQSERERLGLDATNKHRLTGGILVSSVLIAAAFTICAIFLTPPATPQNDPPRRTGAVHENGFSGSIQPVEHAQLSAFAGWSIWG
jgi:hypothetical protein